MTLSLDERIRQFLLTELLLEPGDLGDVLALAARTLSEGLAGLDAALVSGDAALCQHHAHGLKGNLRNMGLSDLAELAKTMEIQTGNGDLAACRDTAERLADLLAPFLEPEAGTPGSAETNTPPSET